MKPVPLLVIAFFVAAAAMSAAGADVAATPPSTETAIAGADARRDAVMRRQLAKPYPPDGCIHYQDFALAAYWLNERTAEADQAILTEREKEFPASLKSGNFHWNAYILDRIYFLFGHASQRFPGRMSAEAEAALLDMLWQWAEPRCRLEMTGECAAKNFAQVTAQVFRLNILESDKNARISNLELYPPL